VLSLTQAAAKSNNDFQLLPDLFPPLQQEGIRFRRGQLTMIAGQPNAGKSLIALYMAVQMKVPTLYISADTDAYTTSIRAAAMITGHQTSTVEEAFITGVGKDFYTNELSSIDFLQFDFTPSPTLDEVDLSIRAYGEAYGQYPHLIIVDNAMNVVSMHHDEWSGLREIAKAMHHIARETGAAVFLLHHTSENEGRPDLPPSRKAIQGKIAQLPEMILTVALVPYNGEFRVAAVKNRFAKHSAGGNNYVTLWADASRMTMYSEFREMKVSEEVRSYYGERSE
jgi:predicted ATP-dependent serine protease